MEKHAYQINKRDETQKGAQDSQIHASRAKKNQVEPRWAQLQISTRHQPTDFKLYVRAVIEPGV